MSKLLTRLLSKTVLTIGTFDILHPGHLELLAACRGLDPLGAPCKVVVGLNKDSFVHRFKGRKPVLNFDQRRECLLACRYVDGVVPNLMDEDASACIELVRPSILAVGSDWLPRERYLEQLGSRAAALIKTQDIELAFVPRSDPPTISTSMIRRRILEDYGAEIRDAINAC